MTANPPSTPTTSASYAEAYGEYAPTRREFGNKKRAFNPYAKESSSVGQTAASDQVATAKTSKIDLKADYLDKWRTEMDKCATGSKEAAALTKIKYEILNVFKENRFLIHKELQN